jgi:hypothetical protein
VYVPCLPKFLNTVDLVACSALVKCFEHIQPVVLEPGSVRIHLKRNDKALLLEISTINVT